MKKIRIIVFLALIALNANAQGDKQLLDFEFAGMSLNGILNIPKDTQPKGIVLIVHGSGRTNAIEQNWYGDVRAAMLKAGYATYMWDKMGCGKSEGTFNYNQTVQNSASEVIAAINALQEKKIIGSDKIGLWGISRAGWINPIVINQYPDIKFWISISGVDDKENFKYLLEENLKINGTPEDSIAILTEELTKGYRLVHTGARFETYMDATENLRNNKFLNRFNNGNLITEEAYYKYQENFKKEQFDKETNLQVYIKDFELILSKIDCPVLALFGEKDKHVDWKKTKILYEETLGRNVDLTIQSFPNCNHNLYQCQTGGFYEFQDDNLPWDRCEGFLDAITNWLKAIE